MSEHSNKATSQCPSNDISEKPRDLSGDSHYHLSGSLSEKYGSLLLVRPSPSKDDYEEDLREISPTYDSVRTPRIGQGKEDSSSKEGKDPSTACGDTTKQTATDSGPKAGEA
ncbi:hypothetical protein I302_105663 [Kwoniella bestiolae CBS 10118]|uniref:Uncharacterized protein n=1 Tax=Kwoniella bestiolae CBS 10118 TaxID=1296100 RepID=A0A1B9G1T5_9TREE|nr:hypothetical protein I302_04781 [Kwoniella bestiolae CBS 10118]OCF24971.1 hypothetical protein I302_04781 [Kwoniella bestiolae CBS 10118]